MIARLFRMLPMRHAGEPLPFLRPANRIGGQGGLHRIARRIACRGGFRIGLCRIGLCRIARESHAESHAGSNAGSGHPEGCGGRRGWCFADSLQFLPPTVPNIGFFFYFCTLNGLLRLMMNSFTLRTTPDFCRERLFPRRASLRASSLRRCRKALSETAGRERRRSGFLS